jgi:pantoate--beta-alanine ligase
MIVARTIQEIRASVAAAKSAGQVVGLVPTMGALHAGHYSLIDAARRRCAFVAVSIFVNPIQFGPSEDLARYPRTPEADLAGCRDHGVAAVLMPDVREMYPRPCRTVLDVPDLGRRLCGASRPGHFAGVCTVVAKLLNMVQPDVAYFGAKDFQQAAIIRRMAEDLNFPLAIEVCPTVREPDGLALSSRNAYLTPDQRRQAPALWEALAMAGEMVAARRPPAGVVVEAILAHLAGRAPSGVVDYVEIVDPRELWPVENTDGEVLIALAVRFGRARLIDNILVDSEGPGG